MKNYCARPETMEKVHSLHGKTLVDKNGRSGEITYIIKVKPGDVVSRPEEQGDIVVVKTKEKPWEEFQYRGEGEIQKMLECWVNL